MQKLVIVVGVTGILGIILLAFLRINTPKETKELASMAETDTRQVYVVGLLNYNPTLAATLAEFKKSLDQQAIVHHVTIQYREIGSTGDIENIQRAVDALAKEHLNVIVTGQESIPVVVEKIPLTPVISILTSNTRSAAVTLAQPDNQVVFIDSGSNTVVGEGLSYAVKLVPTLKTILVVRGPDDGSFANPDAIDVLRETANGDHVTLIEKQFTTREEFNKFFLTYDFADVDAIFRYPDPFITANLDILFAMSRQARVNKPLIVRNKTELEMGGLLAYGTNVENFGDAAADIAYKILTQKVSPSEMSIKRPYNFELGVNTSIAKIFGITIPQQFLEQCDYVVK